MIRHINIIGEDKTFQYLIEYTPENLYKTSENFGWAICDYSENSIHLFDADIDYYRHENIWHDVNSIELNSEFIPKQVKYSNLKIHLPMFSVSVYKPGVKYALNANTWINGHKIDLGTHIFKPTNAYLSTGLLKRGNNEYCECVEFDIMDPFDIIYSDEWDDFRKNICREEPYSNNNESLLNVSLFVVDDSIEEDHAYTINTIYTGGFVSINMSGNKDYLDLNIQQEFNPFRLRLEINENSSYDWLLDYLFETYKIRASHSDIYFELVIKNKNTIIPGPTIKYAAEESNGKCIQYVDYDQFMSAKGFSTFFSTWDAFEDGWSIMASLNVIDRGSINEDILTNKYENGLQYSQYTQFKDDDDIEILNVLSNEIPITQEIFSRYVNKSEKIIDLSDMNITQYNVVNKIENKIVQLERPNESKTKLIQPVFFRVKDTEILTLHPDVTENICINLDDYKSKVKTFILQIDNCRFEQIGANKYGIIFKIPGNMLSKDLKTGLYYILNEDSELVTKGKYSCIR